MRPVPEDSFHAHTLAEWRQWLIENHATSDGVWLLTWGRRGVAKGGKAEIDYEEQICEALCFGWVDSQTDKAEDGRMLQRFTPRRKHSIWTKFNKQRVERLIAEGRMTPAGQAEIDRAKADGRWTLFDDADNLILPGDLAAALDGAPPAREQYEAFPASEKRAVLSHVLLAKRPETRARRIAQAVARAQRGERLQRPQTKAKSHA